MTEEKQMTDLEREKCHKIIHGVAASTAAIGAGLAQVPGSDSVAIVPLQISMIMGLGEVFNRKITKTSAKAILTTQIATITGRSLSQFLVGWIPVAGNIINAATAASITEAIGWGAANSFAKERNLNVLDS